MNETLGSQTQQSGNNTVVVSDTLSNAGNGQIGDGSNGIGDSYVGRLLIISLGGTEQRRLCTAEAAGTGTTRILTVHEDWDTNPVQTTDTIHVPYEPADIEDGGVSGGITFNSKTGLAELSNLLTINSGGGLQVLKGVALEMDDRGSSTALIIQSGGYLYSGYLASGQYVGGGIFTSYNNTAGEPNLQAQSGSVGYLYDFLFWAQLVTQQLENANGAGLEYYGGKFLFNTEELHLYDTLIRSCTILGKGTSTEIVRLDAGSDIIGLILSTVDTLDSAADTTTETIEARDVVFLAVTNILTVRNNKTWNMINPVWSVTVYSDLDDAAVSGAATVNDRRSVDAIVREADGSLLQNALVNVYENTQLADLVLELTTDANGEAGDSFIYRAFVWTSGTGSTTTYGGNALQAGIGSSSPDLARCSFIELPLSVGRGPRRPCGVGPE